MFPNDVRILLRYTDGLGYRHRIHTDHDGQHLGRNNGSDHRDSWSIRRTEKWANSDRSWLGWAVMTIITLLIFFTTHLVPQNLRLVYFIFSFSLGLYRWLHFPDGLLAKAGQGGLEQMTRSNPLFSTFDMSYTSLLFAGAAMYVSNYMVPKHGGFTEAFFHEFVITVWLSLELWQRLL